LKGYIPEEKPTEKKEEVIFIEKKSEETLVIAPAETTKPIEVKLEEAKVV
jgi:hypothetical protein